MKIKNIAFQSYFTFKVFILFPPIFTAFPSVYSQSSISHGKDHKIKIKWVENLTGDFDFKDEWSYPEGVFKNQFGQVSCDGICPEEIDKMKDDNGEIYKDSLEVFYQIIDTVHLYHSIKSETSAYEWAGTNFIEVTQLDNGKVAGISANNIATHSNLVFEIENDFCSAWISYNSITGTKNKFSLKKGSIKINSHSWNKKLLKAEFNFFFNNNLEATHPLYWKGKIYAKIKVE
ncbi:MAG: hypothetical protein AAGI07_09110 [Bacteroidota bacterium]